MEYYIYKGPVLEFDRCIENNWYGKTKAVSMAKAKSNLIYQYKKSTGKRSNAKIDLPGKLVVEGDYHGGNTQY